MIYILFGAIISFVLSAVFFVKSKDFRQRAGILPPDVIYCKDNLDLDMKAEVLWQTPKLNWLKDDIYLMLGLLFVLRWGFILVGIFLIADVISKLFGLPSILPK